MERIGIINAKEVIFYLQGGHVISGKITATSTIRFLEHYQKVFTVATASGKALVIVDEVVAYEIIGD